MNNNDQYIEEDVEIVDIEDDELEQTMNLVNELEPKSYNDESDFEVNEPENNKKTIHKGLIISGIFALVGIACVLTYYFIINNPTNYYKCLSKILVDKIYSMVDYNNDTYTEVISVDVNLTTDMIDSKTLSLINDTTLDIEIGKDRKNKKSYLSLNSNYNKEKLINASVYLDESSSKSYIYLKDYLDKYIELDKDTTVLISSVLKNSKTDNKKAKRIIKKEIMNQIKSSEASKKDGYLVYTVTNIELVNKIKNVLTNLSNNKEFLDCYENKEEVKEYLTRAIYLISNNSINDEVEIKFYAKKKGPLDYNLKELIIEVESNKITFDVSKRITKFNVLSDNKLVFSGTYSNTGKNNKNIVLTLDVPSILTFELKINNKYNKVKEIKFINKKKVSTLEELSINEQQQLMKRINESQINSILSMFISEKSISSDQVAIKKVTDYIDKIETYTGLYLAKKSGVVVNGYDTPIPQLANPKSKYIRCDRSNGIWIGGAKTASCNNFFKALGDKTLDLKDGSIIYLTTDGKVVYNSLFIMDEFTCKYDGTDVSCSVN